MITSILSTVKHRLDKGESLADYASDNVVEVIHDIETETAAAAPNVLKLQGLLVGLVVALQADTQADLDKHSAKVGLAFLGLNFR